MRECERKKNEGIAKEMDQNDCFLFLFVRNQRSKIVTDR